MNQQADKHPRAENYFDMWKTTFCPNFAICSFTFINVVVQIAAFLIMMVVSATDDEGLNEKMFLGLHAFTLDQFGMRMPWKIVSEGEVYRLITPLYVTHSLFSVIVNSIGQMILGFALEPALGTARMIVFYFAVGIGANIVGAVGTDNYATGPEPMIFALLAGMLAMYLFYWEKMQL